MSVLVVVRLYIVQIIHGSAYKEEAMNQYVELDSEGGSRANIFFTTKTGQLVSAAVTQTGDDIAIDPSSIGDAATTYIALNKITPIDRGRFNTAAAGSGTFRVVATHIDAATANKIQKLKIPGVILAPDKWRTYPGGSLAAQLMGFVGYQGTTTAKVGLAGLEKEYQDTLIEQSSGLYVNPFAEIFTNVEELVAVDPNAHKGSIVTSIEPSVQAQLEKILGSVMNQYSPQFAGGIVMDPHTGAIYAMAGTPSYDPNNFSSVDNPIVYQNKEVQGRYEMGSIMKPLTMTAGIDSGAVTPATTYNDTGCITVSTYKVCNFDYKPRGVIPMQQILSQSLNVGASWVATQTGYPTFTRYMKELFGSKTNIDLPNEVSSDLGNLGDGTKPAVNYDTASFGQGITVSPIQMIRGLAVLANGGILPNPHVVSAIQYQSGITHTIPVAQGLRVFHASSTALVTNMLVKVFDEALGKGKYKQEHYSFAAKTGTAQIPMPGGGYYPMGTYLHSLFIYFPAHDPKFIIFMFAWEPHGQEYASATLAQPIVDMSQFLINYYNIPPDR